MKNKFCGKVILPVMGMALLMTACGVLPAEGAENTNNASKSVAKVSIPEEISQEEQEELIRTAVENTLSEKETIRKFCFEDYDRNGRPEAFVLTGKELEEAKGLEEAWDEEEELSEEEYDIVDKQRDYDTQLTLWFAYVQDGEVVSEKIREDGIDRRSDILPLKSATLFQCTVSDATGWADLYQVEENQCKVIFWGGTMDIHTNVKEENSTGESDDFQAAADTYDVMYDCDLKIMGGHTWKPYYFHYENGIVTEYKGQKISLSEFRQEYSNAEQMLQKYQKKQEFSSAIKRENSIVHINFVKREKDGDEIYQNVTFKVLDGELTEPYVQDGIYHTTIEEEGESVQVQYE